jgi:Tol biopolymer transport system component
MIGSTLAHYEITAHLGSGGMGDVYRATDSKLGRAVAIKMLPEELTREPERVARLRREARVLASLNHPSIAVIHGIEEANGRAFLVMELATGATLEARLAEGALPVAEALRVALQIAAGLEAAHESGVVHRDLKPANVTLTVDGTVKLLDFGIAKAANVAMTGAVGATTSIGDGKLGAVVGTPAYMSPEQARGQAVDRRTDIFAFGCVLYEMLTGSRAFVGETVTDIIAHVVSTDPDWSRLPKALAPRVRELLDRCLQKDPRKRQRDSGDIRLDLERALAEPQSRAVEASALARLERRSRMRGIVAGGATACLAVVAVGSVALWPAREDPEPVRFTLSTQPTDARPTTLAVSPDGRYVAYVVPPTTPPTPSLFVRELGSFAARRLEGTDGAFTPFWSPDSRHIGFTTRTEPPALKRVALAGGPPQEIARASGFAGGAWNDDGVVVFSSVDAIWRVPAAGGEPVEVAKVDAAAGERIYLLHSFLPSGNWFLYSSPWGTPGVYAQRLDSTERIRVLPFAARTQYAGGHLLFNREGTLFAQRFDADRLTLAGEPAPLGDGAWFAANGQAKFAASANVLAYELARVQPRELSRLTWYDRSGAVLGITGDPDGADYEGVALSPNGRYVAVHRHDSTRTGEEGDIWIMDRERGTATQLTRGIESAFSPVWSPDGEEVAYTGPGMNVYRQDAAGAAAPKLVVEAPALGAYAYDWFGETLLFGGPAGTLSIVPASGAVTPSVITNASFQAGLAQVSPDGRWIAFTVALEGGGNEIRLRPYPDTAAGQWRLSSTRGAAPRWSKHGKEIVYLAPDNKLMAASFATNGSDVEIGIPRPLFEVNPSREFHQPGTVSYDVTVDGDFFVVNERIVATPDETPAANQIAIVLNWEPDP